MGLARGSDSTGRVSPLWTIYREKAARIQGAGGTSIALLAAIRSSVANVRPKLQRLILETVAVKPLLATGFGAQAGRIHSDFRRRVRRVTRVNDWLEDERLHPTQLTALLTKFLTELTNESFRSDVARWAPSSARGAASSSRTWTTARFSRGSATLTRTPTPLIPSIPLPAQRHCRDLPTVRPGRPHFLRWRPGRQPRHAHRRRRGQPWSRPGPR